MDELKKRLRLFRGFESETIKKDNRQKSVVFFGGEGGTRTLAPVLSQPTPLAGAPRHHLSTSPNVTSRFNIKFA